MTASAISHDASFSKFTFALLEDSGWYKPIYDKLDDVAWGKNKGCEFLNSCDSKKFREFQENEVDCNYYHSAVSYIVSDTYGIFND